MEKNIDYKKEFDLACEKLAKQEKKIEKLKEQWANSEKAADAHIAKLEEEKEKSEGVVIGGEDHKNYIEFGEYLKLQKENEELKNEVERLQKVLYTITGSRDDGEPDLYEDVEGDLC